MMAMDFQELEAEVLRLDPKARARLAGKLLHSLEELSEEEVSGLWAEEAQRRDAEMDAGADAGIPAEDVFRDARSNFELRVSVPKSFHPFQAAKVGI